MQLHTNMLYLGTTDLIRIQQSQTCQCKSRNKNIFWFTKDMMELENNFLPHSGCSLSSLRQSGLGKVYSHTQPSVGQFAASPGKLRLGDPLSGQWFQFVTLRTSHYPGNKAAQQTLRSHKIRQQKDWMSEKVQRYAHLKM